MADLFQCAETSDLSLRRSERGGSVGRKRRRRFQTDTTDVEVFFEAIGLEEIGEFEGADIAPAMADFTLKVSDHPAEILQSEAGMQPLIPLPLPIKAQAQALTGQLAEELMSGGDLLGIDVGCRHTQDWALGAGGNNPGTQGTCSRAN